VTFNPNVNLVANQKYVIFATAVAASCVDTETYIYGKIGNVNAGGNLVYSASTSGNWGVTAWSEDLTRELAFSTTFESPVPATNTTLMTSKTPSVVGESVTFTATSTSAGGTPVGNVTFKDGAVTLGTVPLNGAGVASFMTSSLTVGTHSITAAYQGDVAFAASTSSPVSQVVGKDSTTTAIASSTNPTIIGSSTTLTAVVTQDTPGSGTPTGNVTFKDGANAVGTVALAGGVATLPISSLTIGNHTITADYAGSATHQPSTSPSLAQDVVTDTTTVALTSSVNPTIIGSSTTLTATVTPGTGGSGTPTGNVTFKDGANAIGTVALAAGVATLPISSLTIGTHIISAEYAGSVTHEPNTSSIEQVVMQNDVVIPPKPVLKISPISASLTPGGAQNFAAVDAVKGGFIGTSFALQTNASGGSIGASSGIYKAGPKGNVVDVVRVTDSTGATATANVTVSSSLSITPKVSSVTAGTAVAFAATAGSGTGYTYAISVNPSGATIDATSGAYIAGAYSGDDIVTVTDSLANTSRATVTVAGKPGSSPSATSGGLPFDSGTSSGDPGSEDGGTGKGRSASGGSGEGTEETEAEKSGCRTAGTTSGDAGWMVLLGLTALILRKRRDREEPS
jgi:hypothetical protein